MSYFVFSLACILILIVVFIVVSGVDSIKKAKRRAKRRAMMIHGDKLNPFFPQEIPVGMKLIFSDEKWGYSSAYIMFEKQFLGIISILDCNSYLAAKGKFVHPNEELLDYPLVKKGTNSQAILVNDRFQINVTHLKKDLAPLDHKEWLLKFDTEGLMKIKNPMKFVNLWASNNNDDNPRALESSEEPKQLEHKTD